MIIVSFLHKIIFVPRESVYSGKKNNLHSKKDLFSRLQDQSSVEKLTKTLSQRYGKRKGGYCRLVRAGFRYGDDAPLAIIELVDRDLNAKKVDIKKKIDNKTNIKPTSTSKDTEKKSKTKK